ncbi:helix-turn-helix domain-containing protein [Chryseobacterium binzhouense]|uniref:helix-turn-helix domain-containing protein n=1 Tax=Chryseobacterium binzhouense TaxID=2593646 RepID=UPI00117E926C|nr:AraC family transcriptional regulator [Chryseobacterium binzhouense]
MEINEFKAKKKEFSRYFFYSVLFIMAFNAIASAFADYMDYKLYVVPVWFFVALFFLVAYTGFLLHKGQYNFKVVFSAVIILLFILFTYLGLLLCNISETVYIYYFPVTALFLMLYSFKRTVFFAFFLLVLCFFMQKIANYFGIALDKNEYMKHEAALKMQEYMAVVISVFYTFFIIYYMMKFIEIKNRLQLSRLIPENKLETTKDEVTLVSLQGDREFQEQDDKLDDLYRKAINILEEKKAYQNPAFGIKQLADLLNSNTTYVSAAINRIGKKKFNQLVNEYRINHVLEDLTADEHHRFTIEHIYKSAGFSQQSTFNRIFKQHTGTTPSEYIENL